MRRWKPAGGRGPPLVRSPLPGRGRRAGKRQWWGRCSLKVNANGLVFQRSAGPLGQGDVLFGRGPAHADGPHQLTAVVQGQSTAHQTDAGPGGQTGQHGRLALDHSGQLTTAQPHQGRRRLGPTHVHGDLGGAVHGGKGLEAAPGIDDRHADGQAQCCGPVKGPLHQHQGRSAADAGPGKAVGAHGRPFVVALAHHSTTAALNAGGSPSIGRWEGGWRPSMSTMSYSRASSAPTQMRPLRSIRSGSWNNPAMTRPVNSGDSALSASPPYFSGSAAIDRKSTRLNSSHVAISYAVFCL